MDTSALLIPAFNAYKQNAVMKDIANISPTNCEVVIWDASLGFGRNVAIPIQSDGRTEEKVSHHCVVNVKPSNAHEMLTTIFDGSERTFRFVGDIAPVGNSDVKLWIIKTNIILS